MIQNTFEHAKSTKGASKDRRDKINAEIQKLRDLLPLPSSTRQRLSQLQLMALVCVYVRKDLYFSNTFHGIKEEMKFPQIGFSKALSGFIIMMTQHGKLLYISDNAAEYLGHSMEDLLIQGDSVYDIVDGSDKDTIRETLERPKNANSLVERRNCLCRFSINKNNRRQLRFGDQKPVIISGHYFHHLSLSSCEVPVFIANCSPVVMPETRECVAQGNCQVYTSLHSIDMKYIHLDRNGEFHLGLESNSIHNESYSWYEFIHPSDLVKAADKHRSLCAPNSTEKSAIILLRLKSSVYSIDQPYTWTHVVMQFKEANENGQPAMILCTNQVLDNNEARILQMNNWLYEQYTHQVKLPYNNLAYTENNLNSALSSTSCNGSLITNDSSANSSNSSLEDQQLASSPTLQQQTLINNTDSNSNSSCNVSRNVKRSNYNLFIKKDRTNKFVSNANSLPSPTTNASIAAISPNMPTIKNELKYNENNVSSSSSSSSAITNDIYLTTANNKDSNHQTNSRSPISILPNAQINSTTSNASVTNIPTSTHLVNTINNHSSYHPALHPIAPIDINNDHHNAFTLNGTTVATSQPSSFHHHNLLQYSPQAGTLPTYPSFVSPGAINTTATTTNLFTHSPQHASHIITNTTPPATPPEIVHRHSSSNNSSLNSNSSTGSLGQNLSNKRSLTSSNISLSNSSNARLSPEPKRAYFGQQYQSQQQLAHNQQQLHHLSNNSNVISQFNHQYVYNASNYANSQIIANQNSHQTKQLSHTPDQHNLNQQHLSQLQNSSSHHSTIIHQPNSNQTSSHSLPTTYQQQQYSYHHNGWLPITSNFSDLMPMSGYYGATAHHHHSPHSVAHHQLNAHQINATHQQLMPSTVTTTAVAAAVAAVAVANSTVSNSNSTINHQNYHLNYHHHHHHAANTAAHHFRNAAAVAAAAAGSKLNLFNKNSDLDQHQSLTPTNTEEISNAIAIY